MTDKMRENRGYFGIGVYAMKKEVNYGTLFRSANIFGASFIYLIGRRFKKRSSDTLSSHRHLPLYEYETADTFLKNIPHGCQLIGVEITDNAKPIKTFCHPERAIYMLGAEDIGLPKAVLEACSSVVVLPGDRCLNVSVSGSIIMYDRITKGR